MVMRSMFSIARINKTHLWKIFKNCIEFGRAILYMDILEYIAMNYNLVQNSRWRTAQEIFNAHA